MEGISPAICIAMVDEPIFSERYDSGIAVSADWKWVRFFVAFPCLRESRITLLLCCFPFYGKHIFIKSEDLS